MAAVLSQNSGEVKNIVIYLITTQVCVLLQAVVSSEKKKSVLKQLAKNKGKRASLRNEHRKCKILKR